MKQLLLILLILTFGCSKPLDLQRPSDELIRDGQQYIKTKDYERATKVFEAAILNSYEPSEAQQAQFLLAEAYFLDESYPQAIGAYEIYVDLYAGSPEMPLSLYRLGFGYEKISSNPGRDTDFSKKGIFYFNQLNVLYPNEYEKYDAKEIKKRMEEKLAKTELMIGQYYRRINEYSAAVARFVGLINEYPNTTSVEKSLEEIISIALDNRGLNLPFEDYIKDLEERYPENKNLASFKKKAAVQ